MNLPGNDSKISDYEWLESYCLLPICYEHTTTDLKYMDKNDPSALHKLMENIFLSSRTMLCCRKWLLLLSNSWTDRTLLLQYCWLITMISHSAWFTSYPSISYQCMPQQNFPALVQLVMARCSLIMAKCHSVIRSLVAEFFKYLWKLLSNRWNCL